MKPMKRSKTNAIEIAVALLVGAAVLAGCGGSARPAAEPERAPEEPSEEERLGAPPPPGAPAEQAEPAPMGEAAPGAPMLDDAAEEPDDPARALDAAWGDFERALTLSAPDCVQARTLRDRICDLAERICDLAQANPGEPEIFERCEDGRMRCSRASARLRSSCALP